MAYTAQPIGTLANLVANTRLWANEPSILAKYPTDRLYPLFRTNYREVLREVLSLSDTTFVVQFQLDVVDGTNVYMLPPNVGQMMRISEKDEASGLPIVEYYNASRKSPGGPGFRIENGMLRWVPKWLAGPRTLTFEYIPNGECELHLGTLSSSAAPWTTTTGNLTITPSEGYFDQRPNAYLGSIMNTLGGSALPAGYLFWPMESRTITEYEMNNADGPVITWEPPLLHDPGLLSCLRYEIVPDGLPEMTPLISLRTAITLQRFEGDKKRADILLEEYRMKIRQLRLAITQYDNIAGSKFEHDQSFGDSAIDGIQSLWGIMV